MSEGIENLLYQNELPEKETAMRLKVVDVLRTCYDPEIPVDVYELGLIYKIEVFPVNNIYLEMTLTSPSCPVAESLPLEVQNKIKELEEVNDVQVEVVFEPTWNQDMMSEVAKLELGFM